MRELWGGLRSALVFWPLIVLYTLLLEPVSLLASCFRGGRRVQHRVLRLWSGWVLWTLGMPVTTVGLEGVDASRPRVYVANHLSGLDIPVLYCHLPFPFRIAAHRLVFRVPLVGRQLRSSGELEMDSESLALSRRALRGAVASLGAGLPLVVFPEGKRSPTGEMLPFRRGAFHVAIRAGADVVPMAILGTYEALPTGAMCFRPRSLGLIVGEPIPVARYNLRQSGELAARAQAAVAELCRRGQQQPRAEAPAAISKSA